MGQSGRRHSENMQVKQEEGPKDASKEVVSGTRFLTRLLLLDVDLEVLKFPRILEGLDLNFVRLVVEFQHAGVQQCHRNSATAAISQQASVTTQDKQVSRDTAD